MVKDTKELVSELRNELRASRRRRKGLIEDLFDDDISDTSSFRQLTQSYRKSEGLTPSTLMVELVEHEAVRTRDVPNGEIWTRGDSSPYAIHKMQEELQKKM